MLMQYADELHVRFGERLLSKHWLPPSLTPLLRVSAIALRRRLEGKLFQKSTSATNTGHQDLFFFHFIEYNVIYTVVFISYYITIFEDRFLEGLFFRTFSVFFFY